MFKVISSFLLLTSLLWGQEQTIQFRPPFGGLVQAEKTNINPSDFTIFSNVGVNNMGEIYKRGSLGTIPYNAQETKIDTNSNNPGVFSLYRYYKSTGLRRLLATTIGRPPLTIVLAADTCQFAHVYWMNDTTGRFAYTYTGGPDTMSELEYHSAADTIVIRQNANYSSQYIFDPNATFFLHCSNLSDLQWARNGADDNGLKSRGASVYVVNDTMLVFAEDSLVLSGAHPDTMQRGRAYEVRYRPAHTQTSTPIVFYHQATTYLDTVYYSRSTFDPISWDGKQTNRANILSQGSFTSFPTVVRMRDSTKSWTTNQWTGMWLFSRRGNHKIAGTDTWFSSWYPILRNTTDSLILDSSVTATNWSNSTGDTAYAIVTMPIDEILYERGITPDSQISGNNFFVVDGATFGYRDRKAIYAAPLQVLIIQGAGTGRRYQIRSFGGDSIYINGNGLEGNIFKKDCRLAIIRSRFPIAKCIIPFKERTLWISDSAFQNSIYPSIAGQPGYVEPNTQIVVNPNDGEFIQSAWPDGERVIVGKPSKLYELTVRSIETSGGNPDIWQVNLISNTVGCEAPGSVVQRSNTTWFYDWPQGFYELSGNQLTVISQAIRPMLDSVTAAARDKVVGVYYPSKIGDLILWGLPLNGSLKNNRMIAYSPSTKAWSTWDLTNTDSVRIASAVVQEGVGDAGEMFVGLADSAYILRYNPDANQDTLKGGTNGSRINTFAATIESKRFAMPGQQLRFNDGLFLLRMGGAGTVNLDFYKNLSTTSLQTIAYSASSGDNNFKKSFSDALIGNQLAWRITTASAQTFRFSGLDITITPAGRRLPE